MTGAKITGLRVATWVLAALVLAGTLGALALLPSLSARSVHGPDAAALQVQVAQIAGTAATLRADGSTLSVAVFARAAAEQQPVPPATASPVVVPGSRRSSGPGQLSVALGVNGTAGLAVATGTGSCVVGLLTADGTTTTVWPDSSVCTGATVLRSGL